MPFGDTSTVQLGEKIRMRGCRVTGQVRLCEILSVIAHVTHFPTFWALAVSGSNLGGLDFGLTVSQRRIIKMQFS